MEQRSIISGGRDFSPSFYQHAQLIFTQPTSIVCFYHPQKLYSSQFSFQHSHYDTINWKILMHNLSLSGFKKIESQVRALCRFNFAIMEGAKKIETVRISFGDQFCALRFLPQRVILQGKVPLLRKKKHRKSFIFDYIIPGCAPNGITIHTLESRFIGFVASKRLPLFLDKRRVKLTTTRHDTLKVRSEMWNQKNISFVAKNISRACADRRRKVMANDKFGDNFFLIFIFVLGDSLVYICSFLFLSHAHDISIPPSLGVDDEFRLFLLFSTRSLYAKSL